MILLLAMIFNMIVPAVGAFAAVNNSSSVVEGTYHFTSNERKNIQLEDSFEYRDSCFTFSSFMGCKHLEVLSAQASLASVSRYGEEEDTYEVDPSDNARNIVDMLGNMGFEDVAANKYYSLEKQENSGGVAVGHRTIIADGKEYTLLAIIPRSAGYKQEWVGDFHVGSAEIHEGFKAARDEALRFVKQYMADNSIKGALKVWIAGHSRGAAVSNMLGGFFAGGGIEYFGGDVSITPEDVYCYTFATPRTVAAGADRNTELSVAGNRDTAGYEGDTKGAPYAYTKGGKLDPGDDVYNGIRNFISETDIFPMLPPELWGFTHYGNVISAFEGLDVEKIPEELEKISSFAYDLFINGGDPDGFERKTFDIKTLSLIKDNGEYPAMDMGSLLKERLAGLTYHAMTTEQYVEGGYQEVLEAAAGIYGMGDMLFSDYDFSGLFKDLIEPLIVSYLAYASERLQAEGKAENDIEAVTIAAEELLEYFTGEEIDRESFTVDDAVTLLAKFMSENEGIADKVSELIAGIIPEEFKDSLGFLSDFVVPVPDGPEPTLAEQVKAYLIACYEGPAEGSPAVQYINDAVSARSALYTILYFTYYLDPEFQNAVPGLPDLFAYNESGLLTVPAPAAKLVKMVLNAVLVEKDEDGSVTAEYSLAELADIKDAAVLNKMFYDVYDLCLETFGEEYTETLFGHLETLTDNISMAREMFIYALFYSDGGFDAAKQITTVATLIGNISIVPLAHFNELYLAYAKAANRFPDHPEKCPEHKWDNGTVTTEPTCTENGVMTYTCTVCEETKTEEIAALEHDWDEWTVTTPATEEKEGVETRVCKNEVSHVETRTIPKLDHVHKLSKTDAKAATCDADGHEAYWICSVCGKMFSDENAKNEISNPIDIEATGHDWGEWTVTTAATEEAEGVETRVCKNDKTHVETRSIKKLEPAKVEYKTDEGIVMVDSGAFEEGTTVTVELITDVASVPEFKEKVEALKEVSEDFVIFEFNADKDGAKVQPNGKVKVTIDMPKSLSPDNLKMYYVSDDGKLEEIAITVDKETGTITAELEHFSTYALVNVEPAADPADNAKTGDNTAIITFIALISLAGLAGAAVFGKRKLVK